MVKHEKGEKMRLAIIHTTASTIQSLRERFEKEDKNIEIVNILDDSILTDLRLGRDVGYVRQRWLTYAQTAEKIGADVLLSACSSVGDYADEAKGILSIPVLRIDEPMAHLAVAKGKKILLLATLDSTLNPTSSLLFRVAFEDGKECMIDSFVVKGAFAALSDGDKEKHDRLIREAVMERGAIADVIVFAQASMASAVGDMGEGVRNKILTSPDCFFPWFRNTYLKEILHTV